MGSATLQGVPLKETELQNTHGIENPCDDEVDSVRSNTELQVVPTKSTGLGKESQIDTSDCNLNQDNVTSPTNDDETLPVLETVKDRSDQQTSNIDLQQDLVPDNVTMDTDILDELREFDSMLNLDENLINDLPLVGTQQQNRDTLEPAIDLEIAMDNAKFLEANPLAGPTQRSCRTTIRNTSASTIRSSNSSKERGTPDNTRDRRFGSPRGVMQITSHVLRKPTPDERKDKKFKCDACPFTGHSRAAISIHYSSSHPLCYCMTCGKV